MTPERGGGADWLDDPLRLRDAVALRSDLQRCAGCHDQCLAMTPEVFATASLRHATSRRSLQILSVMNGSLALSDGFVDAVYGALGSGLQHEVCVYRGDPAGWSDERTAIRAARRELVASGRAPDWAKRRLEAWTATGDVYRTGAHDRPTIGSVVVLADSAERAYARESVDAWRAVAAELGATGYLGAGSSGLELLDLGFVEEARAAACDLAARIEDLRPAHILTIAPESAAFITSAWLALGVSVRSRIHPIQTWVARRAARLPFRVPARERVAFHDPGVLARDLRDTRSARTLLRALGHDVVELPDHGRLAPPSGSMHGGDVGPWVHRVAEERRGAARAIGVRLLVTTSPFDQRNLTGGDPPVADLGVLLARAVDNRQVDRRESRSSGR